MSPVRKVLAAATLLMSTLLARLPVRTWPATTAADEHLQGEREQHTQVGWPGTPAQWGATGAVRAAQHAPQCQHHGRVCKAGGLGACRGRPPSQGPQGTHCPIGCWRFQGVAIMRKSRF
jgi:hypothetical protein